MTIECKVVGAEEVVQRFVFASDRLRQRLKDALNRGAIEVQRKVKEEKLTGQVLNVRTGTLRRSINVALSDGSGDVLQSSVGTNLKYARFWELGFQGTVNVRSHQRNQKMGQGFKFAGSIREINSINKKRKSGTQTVNVSAHTRKINQAARPFLRPSLDEKRTRIQELLALAVKGGV